MSRPNKGVKVTDVRATVADDRDRARATVAAPVSSAAPSHTCPRCGFVGQMLAPPPPAATTDAAASYRVVRGGSFVWKGAVCNVKTGDVVLLRNYGEAGIANMRGRGIVLEPLV